MLIFTDPAENKNPALWKTGMVQQLNITKYRVHVSGMRVAKS
jgi:hypothetical protein